MKPLIERVKNLSVEVGECWEWQGSIQSQSTTPLIRYGKNATGVLRAIAMDQGRMTNGLVATNSCRNPKCVNPAHLVLITRASLQKKIAKEQKYHQRADYRITMSVSSKHLRLTNDQVREIRLSHEDRGKIAEDYGISRTHVDAIKRGYSRPMVSNMFAQLMR